MKQNTKTTPADQTSASRPPDVSELPESLTKTPWGLVTPETSTQKPSVSRGIFTAAERRLIESCPPSGGGVHDWSFKVLRYLSRHYSCDRLLLEAARAIFNKFARRDIGEGEIQRQIGNVRNRSEGNRCGSSAMREHVSISGWPEPDLEAIETIVRSGPRLAELQNALTACPDHSHLQSLEIIQHLFPGDPLLCCGKQLWTTQTLPLSKWGGLDDFQFIVPSPMTDGHGMTRDGRQSTRCLGNTGPRRFLVIEFDFKAEDTAAPADLAPPLHARRDTMASSKAKMVSALMQGGFTVLDICAALIHHLSSFVNPAMVVHSGGKSLHAWFPCMSVADDKLSPFMRYAVQMGADRATWPRCQFVRMPGGLRENGNRQKVHYFNREVLP